MIYHIFIFNTFESIIVDSRYIYRLLLVSIRYIYDINTFILILILSYYQTSARSLCLIRDSKAA